MVKCRILVGALLVLSVMTLASCSTTSTAVRPTIREVPNPNFSFPSSIAQYLVFPETVGDAGVASCTQSNFKTVCEPFALHPGMVIARLYGSGGPGVPAQQPLFQALTRQGWTISQYLKSTSYYFITGHNWSGQIGVRPLPYGGAGEHKVQADIDLALWPNP